MGTRGTFGFRIDGEDKLTYNHFDSYPNGLGNDVVEFVRNVKDWNKVREQVRTLRDITDTKPTPEDIKACASVTDLSVSEQNTDDWYCLLQGTQGDPQKILDISMYQKNNEFITDSLFCEYGYIVNLDDMTLEFYKGFQKKKHKKGRYSKHKPEKGHESNYYACALAGSFPIDDIPQNWSTIVFPEEEEEE